MGIDGDYHAKSGKSKRQVTLIQWEHLPVIAALAGLSEARPEMLRRNLAISGLNVQTLKDQRFWIGTALLEGTGDCHPCSRMQETLGPGGYAACRGHGGITAVVLKGGVIRTGDALTLASAE
jgi:MOSC domain-containing protein YiiM